MSLVWRLVSSSLCSFKAISFESRLHWTLDFLDAEIHLTRSVGLAILAIAFLTLFLSGIIPLGSSDSATDKLEVSSPYTGAVINLTMLYHIAAALQSYTAYTRYGSASLCFSTLASCTLSAVGLWCIMFEGGGHVSRRTGRDKRTSGWPFRNKEATK